MKYSYSPKGVCSTQVDFELDGEIIKNVTFKGGCDGNLKAIATLIEGMPAPQVAEKLSGITCDRKKTSCTDQLSKALKEAMLDRKGE